MIDVKVMQESFLCYWFYKLLVNNDHSKWTSIPLTLLKFIGQDLSCFSSKIGASLFKGIEKIELPFWKKVTSAWLHHNKLHNIFDTKMTCIWNNSNVTYQNKVIFFEKWAQKVTFINELTTNNNVKSFEEIETLIGPSPNLILEYVIIQATLKSFMKSNAIVSAYLPKEENWNLLNNKQTYNAKTFRKETTTSNYTEPCSVRFWLNKFNVHLNEEIWKIAYEVTKESRLRELQWKILHNIYPTNIILQKLGVTVTNKCSYCDNEIDFIEHFFFECKKIRKLWEHVENITQAKFGSLIRLDKIYVLLGIKQRSLDKDIYNFINNAILVGKMCVGKFRYGKPIEIIQMFDHEMQIRKFTYW